MKATPASVPWVRLGLGGERGDIGGLIDFFESRGSALAGVCMGGFVRSFCFGKLGMCGRRWAGGRREPLESAGRSWSVPYEQPYRFLLAGLPLRPFSSLLRFFMLSDLQLCSEPPLQTPSPSLVSHLSLWLRFDPQLGSPCVASHEHLFTGIPSPMTGRDWTVSSRVRACPTSAPAAVIALGGTEPLCNSLLSSPVVPSAPYPPSCCIEARPPQPKVTSRADASLHPPATSPRRLLTALQRLSTTACSRALLLCSSLFPQVSSQPVPP